MQNLKLAPGTHKEWFLNPDKKHQIIYQKNCYKTTKTKFSIPNKFTFHTSSLLKKRNKCLNSKLYNPEKNIELQPIQKGPFHKIEKPTDKTYKLIYPTKNKFIQHKNFFKPFLSKKVRSSRMNRKFPFIGLIIVDKPTEVNKQQNPQNPDHLSFLPDRHQNATMIKFTKKVQKNTQNQIPQRHRAIYYLDENILKPETKKSQQRQSSRLRNQPRKDYNIFNPHCKLLKKYNFRNLPDYIKYFQYLDNDFHRTFNSQSRTN